MRVRQLLCTGSCEGSKILVEPVVIVACINLAGTNLKCMDFLARKDLFSSESNGAASEPR